MFLRQKKEREREKERKKGRKIESKEIKAQVIITFRNTKLSAANFDHYSLAVSFVT
jgi:hypothetical protein